MRVKNGETAGIHLVQITLSRQSRRVAELVRPSGAASYWRQQTLASWQEELRRRSQLLAWRQQRAQYAAAHFTKEDARKPPPADGWTWGLERLFSPDGANTWMVEGWFPPKFAAERAPFAGPILPFSSQHPLTLADCYRVLAIVHDADRQESGRIEPFSQDDLTATCAHAVAVSGVRDLTESDRLTLDDCLARVELDLRDKGLHINASAPRSVETPLRPQTESKPNRLLFEQDTWTITFDGMPLNIEKPKAFLIFRAIYECPHITRDKLRAKVSGIRGDKTIPNMIESLPQQLRSTIRSDNSGYWVSLPHKKNPQ